MIFRKTTRLHHHGRIDLGCHPAVWRHERLRSGLLEIPIGGEIAVESVLLMNTGFHNDPADQLIVATAMLARMRLVTVAQAEHAADILNNQRRRSLNHTSPAELYAALTAH